MTEDRPAKGNKHAEADSSASGVPARPEQPQEEILYPTEPELASDGIDEAIRLLESMTAATWQASRDAALARLRRALTLVDQNILRNPG